MSRPKSEHPTELELEILKIIWRQGPSTVSQVRESLAPTRPLAFTSVDTTMKIMIRKGYLVAQKRSRRLGNLYVAAVTMDATLGQMAKSLTHRLFSGSIANAIQSLLGAGKISNDELNEIRKTLSRFSKTKHRDSP